MRGGLAIGGQVGHTVFLPSSETAYNEILRSNTTSSCRCSTHHIEIRRQWKDMSWSGLKPVPSLPTGLRSTAAGRQQARGRGSLFLYAASNGAAQSPWTSSEQHILGIDFGGTGIKSAPVDLNTGRLLAERVRFDTPHPATPQAVAEIVSTMKQAFNWQGSIGVGMPSVVRRGMVKSAANIDKSWIDINAKNLFEQATGCKVAVINDADAAGFAELAFGAGKQYASDGVVLMTTWGTGIGTAMFVDGKLVPNLELGHIEVDGTEAEKWASERVREKEDLSWKKWAGRANAVLARLERYLQPDLIIIGGGISKKEDKFLHLLSVPGGSCIVAASMRNEAGIIGAAIGGSQILQAEETSSAAAGESMPALWGNRSTTSQQEGVETSTDGGSR